MSTAVTVVTPSPTSAPTGGGGDDDVVIGGVTAGVVFALILTAVIMHRGNARKSEPEAAPGLVEAPRLSRASVDLALDVPSEIERGIASELLWHDDDTQNEKKDARGTSFGDIEAVAVGTTIKTSDTAIEDLGHYATATDFASGADGENDYIAASWNMSAEEIEVGTGMEELAAELGTDDDTEVEDELRREEHEASKRIRVARAKQGGITLAPDFPSTMGMVELDASEIKFDPSSVQTETAEEIQVGTGMEELAASERGVSTEAPAMLLAGPIVKKPHRSSCSLRERDAEMGMLDLRNSEEDMAEAIMKSTAAMELT